MAQDFDLKQTLIHLDVHGLVASYKAFKERSQEFSACRPEASETAEAIKHLDQMLEHVNVVYRLLVGHEGRPYGEDWDELAASIYELKVIATKVYWQGAGGLDDFRLEKVLNLAKWRVFRLLESVKPCLQRCKQEMPARKMRLIEETYFFSKLGPYSDEPPLLSGSAQLLTVGTPVKVLLSHQPKPGVQRHLVKADLPDGSWFSWVYASTLTPLRQKGDA